MEQLIDNDVDDLLFTSDALLQSVADVAETLAVTSAEENISGDMHNASVHLLEESFGLQMDGYTEVRVAANEMSAVADIHPAGDGMKPIDPDAIAELLNSNRINTGVDWNAIKEAVFRCNTEKVQVADLLIARGTAPTSEVPEQLVIENELLMQNDRNVPDRMRADYKASSPFVLVKNGQLLATYAPKKPGQMGTTVKGEALPYKV
ncbi:MAG: DUF342 domain-containing protein, partial [Spirochaetaceae bacterium]|nr:DUF342 domain-containing protein [Spirochaetaceae bacterium]